MATKILLVEDEAKTVAYLSQGFKEQGFSVDVAKDGEQGLALATKGEYDLLILDVMLPGLDGWEILTRLRKNGKRTLALFSDRS